ncbi:MAG: FtsW/RodA/SpoVE family cell cycle protein [Alistipes sp.]|nr:FtsW/RodA/SpoVE family cell cycle protein [Alistipes sp.]
MDQTDNKRGAAGIFAGDKLLWIIIAVLATVSLLVVYSSTAKMTYDAYRSSTNYFNKQIFMLAIGAALLLVTHRINCRFYMRYARLFYFASLLLTIATYFIGMSANGAARWIPIMGFRLQPSEALKVATVIMLARQLATRQDKIAGMKLLPSFDPRKWSQPAQKRILREATYPILGPVICSCAVIFPAHFSSTLIVFAASLVMMLIGRVNIRELVRLITAAMVAVLLAMSFNIGRSSTASGRFGTWLDSWTHSFDSQNPKDVDKLTDTERSMIAIHNGGLLGEGAGRSVMRVEITHPESDYAYAFFIEEYGLITGVILMMLYLWIFFRAMEVFKQCGTAFPGLLVLGLALLITCQALLHIAVTVNLLPETGQNLPLISHGGSSMFFTAIALGMILSVSRQNEEKSHQTPKKESILEK